MACSNLLITSKQRLLLTAATILTLSLPTHSFAWGADGHAVVGKIAIESIDTETREWLEEIILSTSPSSLRFACNWPDIVRELPQYDYSRPFHYVNLPRNAGSYQRERDCHDGRCVTEKIKYFAARLAQEQLSIVERSKAFNWLCHLTGDLHQPLHAGFSDDRGGNTITVNYHQDQVRLHQLWDRAIITKLKPNWQRFAWELSSSIPSKQAVSSQWNLSAVDEWTNDSHQLVVGKVYPEKLTISTRYEQQSLKLIEKQLKLAGLRLAKILQAIRTGQVNRDSLRNN